LLIGTTEALVGTLCHFDVVGHGLSDPEFQLLERAGRALPAFLPSAF